MNLYEKCDYAKIIQTSCLFMQNNRQNALV